jgi:hypothetical protein
VKAGSGLYSVTGNGFYIETCSIFENDQIVLKSPNTNLFLIRTVFSHEIYSSPRTRSLRYNHYFRRFRPIFREKSGNIVENTILNFCNITGCNLSQNCQLFSPIFLAKIFQNHNIDPGPTVNKSFKN